MAVNINKIIEESMRGPRAQEALGRYNKVMGAALLKCIIHDGVISPFHAFACRYCAAKQKDNPYWMCYFCDDDLCSAENPLAKQFKCKCAPTKEDVEVYKDEYSVWRYRFKGRSLGEGILATHVANVPQYIMDGYQHTGEGMMVARPATHAMINGEDLRKIIREEIDKIDKTKEKLHE